MKITKVEARSYRVAVKIPLLTKPNIRELVLISIETDEGIAGYGMTSGGQRAAVETFVNHELGPALVGRDPLPAERIWGDLYQFNRRANTAVWSLGTSAVDIALWDIRGKHYGVPTADLLGGARKKVPVYITYGVLDFSREQLVEVAKMWVAQGQTRLKMVVAIHGGEDPEEDAARVHAVREAIGDKVQLMIDGNMVFNFTTALRLAKLVEDCNLTWFEEPVYGNDFRLMADLRRKTTIPLSAGQSLGNIWEHRELIVNQALDYAQPNAVNVGGYTEGLKVAALARAFNIPIANGGGFPHHNIALHAAAPNGSYIEFHYSWWKVAEALFGNVAQPVNGWVEVPQVPGLGMEPSPDIERYRIQ